MKTSPPTRPSLILRLGDPRDAEAWGEFVEVYAPAVYDYCRRRGLQDADSADVVQDVLRAVAVAAPRFQYDSNRGTFRGWLFRVTRSKLSDFVSRRRGKVQARGGTTIQEILESVPERDSEAEWDRAWRLQTFAWAAERVRKEVREPTWRAFWETAVRSRPAVQVAAELAMTPGAMYVARSRVLARLRARIEDAGGEAPSAGESFDGQSLSG